MEQKNSVGEIMFDELEKMAKGDCNECGGLELLKLDYLNEDS